MPNASLFTVKSRTAYSKIENQWLVDSGCKRMWHVCDESASAEKVLKRLFLTYFCSCFCCCHVLSSLLLNHSKLVLDTNGPLKKKGVRKREIDRTGLPTKHYQKKILNFCSFAKFWKKVELDLICFPFCSAWNNSRLRRGGDHVQFQRSIPAVVR